MTDNTGVYQGASGNDVMSIVHVHGDDLIHALLHLLLASVLLPRLARSCDEAMVRVQALVMTRKFSLLYENIIL